MPSRPIGSSDPHTSFSGSFWLLSKQSQFAVIHRPEKSGWPSAAFGAGAVRFGLPSAVLGTFGVGYFNHCAPAGPLEAMRAPSANANERTLIDFPPRPRLRPRRA